MPTEVPEFKEIAFPVLDFNSFPVKYVGIKTPVWNKPVSEFAKSPVVS